MNQLTTIENSLTSYENDFKTLLCDDLSFAQECEFAMQAFKGNNYLASTATKNPESLKNAIANVAAIGISLNPALKLAYLVPRGGKVCLDPSYLGLVKLSTDSGSVMWVQAELVYKNDTFEYTGVGEKPIHKADVFSDRGSLIGVYCVAKTADGEFLSETMSIAECHEIRDRTEAYKAFKSGKTKSCPWSTDEGEMVKKTVIKRASKLWPRSDRSNRFELAVQASNAIDGIDFSKEMNTRDVTPPSDEQVSKLKEMIAKYEEQKKTSSGEVETRLLNKLSKDNKAELNALSDLNEKEVVYALGFLSQYVEA